MLWAIAGGAISPPGVVSGKAPGFSRPRLPFGGPGPGARFADSGNGPGALPPFRSWSTGEQRGCPGSILLSRAARTRCNLWRDALILALCDASGGAELRIHRRIGQPLRDFLRDNVHAMFQHVAGSSAEEVVAEEVAAEKAVAEETTADKTPADQADESKSED